MSQARASGRLRALATLVRLPNLFTAPPDVILGAALIAGVGGTVSPSTVAGLAVASMLLYAAGTTLNDYADADIDRRQRPERPIPAGAITRQGALVLGVVLLSSGVALAGLVAGPAAGGVAATLAVVIVLYDGLFKGGPIGFAVMGAARGLNVVLGAAVGLSAGALSGAVVVVPAVIAVYIAGVTYMAARETKGDNRPAILAAAGGVGLALLAVGGRLAVARPRLVSAVAAVALAAGFLTWTGRALLVAYRNPVPSTVGPAVGTCVLGLVVLNAALAATVGIRWALAAVVFLGPAVGLSGLFDVT